MDAADEGDDATRRQAEQKGLTVRVFDAVAHSYGTGLDLFDAFGRDLVEAAAIRPGERVLDVACGRGACLRPACEAVGDQGFVLGIDLAPTMVALTADALRDDDISNPEVRVGDAEDLDLPDESFDVVVSALACSWCPHRTSRCWNASGCCATAGDSRRRPSLTV